MEVFLPDNVKAILLALVVIVFVLSRLARWFPHVALLQIFRLPNYMSEAQKEKRRRSGNRMAGLEIMLVGAGLPLLYFASTVVSFSEPKPIPAIIVAACSVVCIALGIWIFVRNW